MQPQPISRRGFLLLAGVAGLLAGCGTEQTAASRSRRRAQPRRCRAVPLDVETAKDYWTVELMSSVIYPRAQAWPTTEFYLDVFLYPACTEFTVMQTLGPNTYAWGYLAARQG